METNLERFIILTYTISKYKSIQNIVSSYRNSKLQFKTEYEIVSNAKIPEANSFANWSTNRYFFVNKYLGISFKANISHEPWSLSNAVAKNSNLLVLDKYKINAQYPQTFYCKEIKVSILTI